MSNSQIWINGCLSDRGNDWRLPNVFLLSRNAVANYMAPIDACTLRWRHNDHAGVSNHQPHGCLLNRLFRRTSKKTSKLRVTGLCAGNSPGTGEFPAQMASYVENVSIWWRHYDLWFITGNEEYLNILGSDLNQNKILSFLKLEVEGK